MLPADGLCGCIFDPTPINPCAGLRITDARRFVGWAAGGEVAAAPSDDEDDAKAGLSQPSQPQLTTPPALRDTRPEPSGSGTRRFCPCLFSDFSLPEPRAVFALLLARIQSPMSLARPYLSFLLRSPLVSIHA